MCNCPELQAKLVVGFMSIKLINFHFIFSAKIFGVIDCGNFKFLGLGRQKRGNML
jgi:hypothetical protein